NGLPSRDNPYVFNGDFVDRGMHSVEVLVLLLVCMLVWKDAVFLNRGNHEDFNVNLRYGFLKEIMFKYTVSKFFPYYYFFCDSVCLKNLNASWLPIATLIDNKVFVVHGGVSSETDLKVVAAINRHQFVTVLQPPLHHSGYNANEWRQLVDLLWSDPRPQPGCRPNDMRGGGSFFGPDVTAAFLRRHKLDWIIRSHECKPDGFEYAHNGKVLTIFSASNYYDIGSNRGAYVKLVGPRLVPHTVMFVSTAQTRKATIQQRSGYIEHSALKELKHHIYACQTPLRAEFQKYDPESKGTVTMAEWCSVMEKIVGLHVTWRILCPKIAQYDAVNGTVLYESTFDEYALTNKLAQVAAILNRLISMEEFKDACDLLGQHVNTPMSQDQVEELARSIDINKDGFIDFNEFLEAFRLVDKCPPSSGIGAEDSVVNRMADERVAPSEPRCNGVPVSDSAEPESYCTKL
ncbi:hypothetical protein HPB47_012047, partial [Ixodes persulcatus]